MKRRVSLIWTTGGLIAVRLGGAGLAFASQVWLANHYSPSIYGTYAFSWSVLLLASAVAERGIGSTALRFIPIYQEKKNIDLLSAFLLWSNRAVLRTGFFVTALLLGISGVVFLVSFDRNVLSFSLACFGLSFLALAMYHMTISTCFDSAIPAFLVYQVGMPLSLVVGSIILTAIGDTNSPFALCGLLVAALAIIYWGEQVVIKRRFVKPLLNNWNRRDTRRYGKQKDQWRRVSASLLLTRISEVTYYHAGTTIAGIALTPDTASAIFITNRIADLLTTVGFGISFISAPRLARRSVNESRLLKREYRLALFAVLGAFLPCASGLILFNEWLLGLFGQNYVTASPLLIFFVAGSFFSGLGMPAQYLLVATGNHQNLLISISVSSVLYVLLASLLIWDYGNLGIAFSFTITSAMRMILLLFFAKRSFKTSNGTKP